MYVAVLFIHSWLRYAVLGMGLWLLVAVIRGLRRGDAWAAADDRVHARFLAVLDVQFLLGLLLYFWLSPIAAAARADWGATMKEATLRFFGMEHLVTMFLAIAIVHVARARSKRREGSARYRTVLIAQCLWLVLTLVAIPWPGLDIARPLFRM